VRWAFRRPSSHWRVASIEDADGLSTVALALAILAFAISVLGEGVPGKSNTYMANRVELKTPLRVLGLSGPLTPIPKSLSTSRREYGDAADGPQRTAQLGNSGVIG
jgi:hypothetical protein